MAARETVRAALVVVVVGFTSFADVRRGGGAGVRVGPRALVMFSCFAASICAALLTSVPVSILGSLTTYEVVSLLLDSFLTRWGIRPIVVVGRGARTLRPAHKIVRAAIRSVVAASCLAASYFLYALTWASCCLGWVGARIKEVDDFLSEGVVLLP